MDSSWTDGSGNVSFAIPADGQAGLGLDVQRADSLGMAPSAFANTLKSNVQLAVAHKLTIPADSTGKARCFVPGSHFASSAGTDGSSAVISLPQGTWNLAIARGRSAPVVTPFVILKDTLVVVHPALPDSDTTHRQIVLPQGPSISLDSFQLNGMNLYLDQTFWPSWTVREDTLSTEYYSRSAVDTTRHDSLILSSRPGKFWYRGDSAVGQIVSEVQSYQLPQRGTIALVFVHRNTFPSEPQTNMSVPASSDSGFYLLLSLNDNSGAGARITLDSRAQAFPDSFRVRAEGSFKDSLQGTDRLLDRLENTIWYFSWDQNSISVYDDRGLLGAVALGIQPLGAPRLSILFGSYRQAPRSMISLRATKLYMPR